MTPRKPVVLICGTTGYGKTTTINTLFGEKVGHVGHFSRGTERDEIYEWEAEGENIRLIDLPGLGDSKTQDRLFARIYREWVPKADAFLVVTQPPRPLAYGTLRTINLLLSNRVSPSNIIIGINRLELLRDDAGPVSLNGLAGPRTDRDLDLVHQFLEATCRSLNEGANRKSFTTAQLVAYDAEAGWNLYPMLSAVLATLPDEALPHWQQAVDESGREFRTKRGAQLAEELAELKERRAALRREREELARERERLERERELRIEADKAAAAAAEEASRIAAAIEKKRKKQAEKRRQKQAEKRRQEELQRIKRERNAADVAEERRRKHEAESTRDRVEQQSQVAAEARKVAESEAALREAQALAERERDQRLEAEAEADAAREDAEQARREADEERERRAVAELQAERDRAHAEKERRIQAEEESQRLREAELDRQERDLEKQREALAAQEEERAEHDRRLGSRIARWVAPVLGDARAAVVASAVHKVGGFLAKVGRALLG